MMPDYRLVPVEPTEKMIESAVESASAYISFVDAEESWAGCLAAAPDPAADEALVETWARAIYEATGAINPSPWSLLSKTTRNRHYAQARAVLALARGR
jgi:hypothetical protein